MVNAGLTVPIEGIKVEIRGDLLVIRSEQPLKTLSSAVLNGGLREADIIVNCQVPKDYNHIDPKGYLSHAVRKAGFSPERVVGLMTAVDIKNAVIETRQSHGLTISSVVTAGLSNAIKVGENISEIRAGTINIILLIDGNLTESCMVDALKTAIEAKTAALRELDIRSSISFEPASGTSTDSIVVACTKRGEAIEYAGPATRIGEMIGASVIKTVKDAIRKQEGIVFLCDP
jgi:iron complex transport system ATP-binding protein